MFINVCSLQIMGARWCSSVAEKNTFLAYWRPGLILSLSLSFPLSLPPFFPHLYLIKPQTVKCQELEM